MNRQVIKGIISLLNRRVITGLFFMLLLAVFLSMPGAAIAASATWNGSFDGDWSNVNNWDGPPANVPGTGAGETATFNAGAVNCDTNLPASLGTLDVQADYTGTITLPDAMSIDTVSMAAGNVSAAGNITIGSFTITGGTFNDGGNIITVTGSMSNGGTYTSAGTLEFDGGGNFNPGAATYTNLTLTSGTVVLLGNLELNGNFVINGGVFSANGNDITGSPAYTNNAVFELQGPETIVFNNDDTDSGTVRYVGTGGVGTIDLAESNANFTNFGTAYYKLEINDPNGVNAKTFNTQQTLTINNDFNVTGGHLWLTGSGIIVKGNMTLGAASEYSTGAVNPEFKFAGPGAQSIDTQGKNLGDIQISNTSGNAVSFTSWSSVNNTGNITVDASAKMQIDLAADLDLTNLATLSNSGTLIINNTLANAAFTSDSAVLGSLENIEFTASVATNTLTLSDNLTAAGLSVASGVVDMDSFDLAAGSLSISGGTLDLSDAACDVSVSADVTVTSGELIAPAALDDTSFTVAGNWEVSGSGTFTSSGGRVLFNSGAAGKSIITSSTNADDFYDVKFSSAAGSWSTSDDLSITNDLLLSDGTFTVAAGHVLAANRHLTQTGGTFNGGDQNITVGGNVSVNGIFNSTTAGGNTSSGLLISGGLTLSGGSITPGAGRIYVQGNTGLTGGTLYDSTVSTKNDGIDLNGNFTIDGGTYDASNDGDLIVGGKFYLVSGIFNQPASTGNFYVGGAFEIDTGTFIKADASDISFEGGGIKTFLPNSKSLSKIVVYGGTTVNLQESLTCISLFISTGTFNVIGVGAGTTMTVTQASGIAIDVPDGHKLTLLGAAGPATIDFTGDGAVLAANSTGIVQMGNTSNACTIKCTGGTGRYTGNEIDYNSQTLHLSNMDYQTDIILDNNDKLVLSGNCIFDAITINGAGAGFTDGGFEATVSGNYSLLAGTHTLTGTLLMTGSGKTLRDDVSLPFNNFKIDAGATVSLATAIDVNGNLTITTGTLDGVGDANDITVAGNWGGAGTFVNNGADVTFDAAAGGPYTITPNGAFDDLTMDSGAGSVTWNSGGSISVTGNTLISATATFSTANNAFSAGGNITKTAGTGSMTINNNLTLTGNCQLTADTDGLDTLSVQTLDLGDNTLTLGNAASDLSVVNAVTIDSPAEGIITNGADLILTGGLVMTAGNLKSTGGKISLNAASDVDAGLIDFQGSTTTLSIASDFDQSGGGTISNTVSATLELTGDAIWTTANPVTFNTLTLNANTLTLGDANSDLTIDAPLLIGAGAEIIPQAADLVLMKNLTINASGKYTKGSGLLKISGGAVNAPQTINDASGSDLGAVSITSNSTLDADTDFVLTSITTAGAGNTLAPGAHRVTVTGSGTPFDVNGGTFTNTGSEIYYNLNSGPVAIPALTFNNLTIDQNQIFTPASDIDVNGNLLISDGTLDLANGTTLHDIAGNITVADSVNASLSIGAAKTVTVHGNFVLSGSNSNLLAGAGSTVVLDGGTVLNMGVTSDDTDHDFENLTISSGAYVLANNLYIDKVLSIDGGTIDFGSSTVKIAGSTAQYITGDQNRTDWSTGTAGAHLIIETDTDQTLPAGETYGALTLSEFTGGSGTPIFTMGSTINGTWTINAGVTVNMSADVSVTGGNVVINGTLNTKGYELNLTNGSIDINTGGVLNCTDGGAGSEGDATIITLAGDPASWDNAGTFTAADCTVAFTGTNALNTIVSGGSSFNVITITGANGVAGDEWRVSTNDLNAKSITINAGTLNMNDRALTLTQGLELTSAAAGFSGGSQAISIGTDFIDSAGALVTMSSNTTSCEGNFTLHADTVWNNSSGTLSMNGSALQTVTLATNNLNNLVIANTDGGVSGVLINDSDLLVNVGGTLDVQSSKLTLSSNTSVTGAVTIAAAAGLDTNAKGLTLGANLTKAAGAGELVIDGNLTLSGNCQITADVSGNDVLSVVTLDTGNHTLTLGDANSDLTVANQLIMDNALDVIVSQTADLILSGGVDMTNGTISSSGGKLSIGTASSQTGGSLDFLNAASILELGADYSQTGGTIDNTGSVTLSLSTSCQWRTLENETIDTLVLNAKTLTLVTSGTSGLNIEGTFTCALGDGLVLNDNDVNVTGVYTNTGGTVNDSGSGVFTVRKEMTGAVDQTVSAGNYSDIILNMDTSSVKASLNGSITVNNLTLTRGIFDFNGHNVTVTGTFSISNDSVLRLKGSETVSVTAMDTDSGLVEFTGSGSGAVRDITSANANFTNFGSAYYNLRINDINGTKDTFSLGAGLTVNGTLEIASGTFDFNDNTLTCKGTSVVIGSGAGVSLVTGTASPDIHLNGDMNYSDAGNKNPGDIKIGASPDTVTLTGNMTADSLVIEDADILNLAGFDLDIGSGGITVNGTGQLNCSGPGSTINCAGNITFSAGSSYTPSDAVIVLDGTAGQTVDSQGKNLGSITIANTDASVQFSNWSSANNTGAVIINANADMQFNTSTALDLTNLASLTNNGKIIINPTGPINFTSDNAGLGNIGVIEVNGASTVTMLDTLGAADLTITAGTLNTGNNLLNVTGTYTQTGGTVSTGTADVTISGAAALNGGTFTSGNGNLTFSDTLTLSDGNLNCSAVAGAKKLTLANLVTLNSGLSTLTLPAGTADFKGNLNITAGSLVHTSGTVLFSAATAQAITLNGEVLNNITISNTAQKATLTDYATGLISGTIDLSAPGANLVLQMNGNTDMSAVDALTANGILTLKPTASISLTTGSSLYGSMGNVDIDDEAGGYTVTLSDTMVTAGLTIKSGTFDAADNVLTVNNNLTVSGGILDLSDASCDTQVSGNVVVTSGTLTAPAALDDTSFTVGGNWEISGSGTFTHSGGRVLFNSGAAGKSIVTSSANADDFHDVKFSNAAGGWTLSDGLTVLNDIYIQAGTLAAGPNTLTVNNNINVTGGTLDLGNAACDTNVSGNVIVTSGTLTAPAALDDTSFTVGGNWDVSGTGTFTHSGGRVLFNSGAAGKSIVTSSANADDFYDVKFNNAAGGWTLSDALAVLNDFYFVSGTFSTGNNILNVTGAYTQTGGTVSTGTADVTISGAAQISSGTLTSGNGNLTFSDTLTLSGGNLNCSAVTQAGGKIVKFTGHAVLNNGASTLTLAPGASEFTGNLTVTAGALAHSSGAVYFTGSSQLTANGNVLNNVTIGSALSGGVLTFSQDAFISGNLTFGNTGTVTLDFNSRNLSFSGPAISFTNADNILGTAGSGLNFSGTGLQSYTPAGKSAGAITISNTDQPVTFNSWSPAGNETALTLNGGAVLEIIPSATLTLANLTSISNNGLIKIRPASNLAFTSDSGELNTIGDIEIIADTAARIITLADSPQINDLTLTQGVLNLSSYNLSLTGGGNLNISGGSMNTQTGILNVSGPSALSSGTLTLGNKNHVFTGAVTLSGGNLDAQLVGTGQYVTFGADLICSDAASTLDLPAGEARVGKDLILALASVNHHSGLILFNSPQSPCTLNPAGKNLYNLKIGKSGAADTVNLTNPLNINNFVLDQGTFSTGNNAFTAAGTMTVSAGAFNCGTETISVTGLSTFAGGTFTSSDNNALFTGGITLSGGILDLSAITSGGGHTADINGPVTVSSGTLSMPQGQFVLSNNFSYSSGTVNFNSGTLVIDGSSAFNASGLLFHTLKIGTASNSGTLVLEDTLTVNSSLVFDSSVGSVLSLRNGAAVGKTLIYNGSNLDMTQLVTLNTSADSLINFNYTGTCVFNSAGKSLPSLKMTSGCTLSPSAGSHLDVNGNIHVDSGGINLDTNDVNLNLSGNITIDSGETWTASDTAALKLDTGAVHQITDGSGTQNLGKIELYNSGTVNLNSNATAFTFSDITGSGTLNLNSYKLTLTGTSTPLVFNSTTFNPGTGEIAMTAAVDPVLPDTEFSNLTISAPAGSRITLTDDLKVTGNLTVSSGILVLSDADTHIVQGDFVLADTANAGLELITGTPTITFNGNFALGSNSIFNAGADSTVIFNASGGTATINPGGTDNNHDFENFKIDNAGGTINIGADLKVNKTFQILHGTCSPQGNDITVSNILHIVNNDSYWNNSGNAGTFIFGGIDIDASANSVFISGTGAYTIRGAAAKYSCPDTARSNWQAGSNLVIETDQNHTGADKLPSGESYGALTLRRFSAGGTPAFEMGSTINGHWTIGAGANVTMTEDVTVNNGNIVIDGGILNTAGYNIILNSGNVQINSGTLNAAAGAGGDTNISMSGSNCSWTNQGTFTASTSTVEFKGSAENNAINPGGSVFNNIIINGSDGTENDTWAVNSNPLIANSIQILSGTLNANNQSLTVNGNLSVNNLTGRFDGSNQVIDINGNFDASGPGRLIMSSNTTKVSGNFVLAATSGWDNGSGTLELDGTGIQTVTLASKILYNMSIANSAALVTVDDSDGTINLGGKFSALVNSGSVKFNQSVNVVGDFSAAAENLAFTFNAGSVITVGGTFSIDGKTSGSKAVLRSSASPTQYRLSLSGQSEAYYADFKDCNIDEGTVAAAPGITAYNSTNSGNNDIDRTAPETGRLIFSTILPGSLTDANVRVAGTNLDTFAAGSLQTLEFVFTRSNALPAGSRIVVEFPRGFDLSKVESGNVLSVGAPADITIAGGASAPVVQDNRRVVITLGAAMSGDTLDDLRISNIRVPSIVTAAAGQYKFYTTDDGGNVIDQNLFVQSDSTTQGLGGALGAANIDLSSLNTNTDVEAEITFRTVNPVPPNGRIYIGFPNDYTITAGVLSVADTVTSVSFDGAIASASGDNTDGLKNITITRDNSGTQIPAGTEVTLKTRGIRTPGSPGASGNVTVKTQTSAPADIDTVSVSGILIGTFTVSEFVTGTLTLYGDSGYAHKLDAFKAGDTIYIEVIDGDRNTDNTGQQNFTVAVSSNNVNGGAASDDTDQVTLTETTNTSGVFRGTLSTTRSWADEDNNDGTINVVEADGNDRVIVTYSDPLNASGQADPAITSSALCHYEGSISITPQRPGLSDNVVITITDQDLNAAGGAAGTLLHGGNVIEITTSTGDDETYNAGNNTALNLVETGPDTGVFVTGSIALNTAAVTDNNGLLNINLGAIITAVYAEETRPYTLAGIRHSVTAIAGSGSTGFLSIFSDDSYTHEQTRFSAGETIYFEIRDSNANVSSSVADTIVLKLITNSSTGQSVPSDDTENLTLTETGISTGIFRGSIDTVLSRAVSSGNNISSAAENSGYDKMLLRYEDSVTAEGISGVIEKTIIFNSDMIFETPAVLTLLPGGSMLEATVKDQDLNKTAGIDTFNINLLSSTGDAETLTLTETGAETGIFTAQISVVRGTAAAVDNIVNAIDGGTITLSAVDTETKSYAGQNTIIKNCIVTYQKGYTGSISVLSGSPEGASGFYIGQTLIIEVNDPDLTSQPVVTAVTSGGDSENFTLINSGNGIYRLGVKPVSDTLPSSLAAGNSSLSVLPGQTLTFTYTDALDSAGNVNSARSFVISAAAFDAVLTITDNSFAAVKTDVSLLEPLYFKVVNYDSNMDAQAIETIQITVTSKDTSSTLVDTENVTLTETGADTGIFSGLLPVDSASSMAGVLQAAKDYTVQAVYTDPLNPSALPGSLSAQVSANAVFRVIEMSHNAGAILQITSGSTVKIIITDPFRSGVSSINMMVTSSSGDSENISLTGDGASTFTSSDIPVRYGKTVPADNTVQASESDIIRCLYIDSAGKNHNLVISTGSASTGVIESFNNLMVNNKPAVSKDGKIWVRVFDPDMNTDSGIQTVTAVLSGPAANGGDILSLPLAETGPSTGIFEGSTSVYHGPASVPGQFEFYGSGDITASYNDAKDSLGNTDQTRSFTIAYRNNAEIAIEALSTRKVITAGETIEITLIDPDMDTTTAADKVQVTVISSMGDVEVVELTETGTNTGIFTRALLTAKSTAYDEPAGTEKIQVQPGDTISVTYTDTINCNPGTAAVRSDRIDVSQDRLNNVMLNSYDLATFQPVTSYYAGVLQPYQFTFYTTNTLPADGKITFEFPGGFDLSKTSIYAVNPPMGVNFGTGTISVQGSIMTITRNKDGDSITAGNGVAFYFRDVINPPVTGGTGTFLIRTLSSSGDLIDLSQPIPGVTIVQDAAAVNTSMIVTPSISPVLANTHVIGQEGECLFKYTNLRLICPDSYFVLYFDSQFDISGVKGTALKYSYSYMNTGVSPPVPVNVNITEQMDISIVANSITLKRRSLEYIPAGAQIEINVGQAAGADSAVKNPPYSVAAGGLTQFQLYMYTSRGVLLESALAPVPAMSGGRDLKDVVFELNGSQAASFINAAASFKTEHQLPADGKIRVTFPQGFDLSRISEVYAADSALTGNLTYYINTIAGSLFPPNVITLVRSGGKFGNFEVNPLKLVFVNVMTPSGDASGTKTFAVETQTSLGNRIDSATAVQITGSTGEIAVTDKNFTSTVSNIIIGSNIFLRVKDIDLNKNVSAVESVFVNLRGSAVPAGLNDTVQIELFETGVSSEVFTGSAETAMASVAVPNNKVLEVKLGETITAQYIDVLTKDGIENKSRTYTVSTSQVNISIVKYDVTRDSAGNPVKKADGSYVTVPFVVNNATPPALAVWEVLPVKSFGVTVEAAPGLNVSINVETFSGDSENILLDWNVSNYEKNIPVIYGTPAKGNGIIEVYRAEKISFTYSEGQNTSSESTSNSANLVTLNTRITPHSMAIVTGDRQRANEGPLPGALQARLVSEFNIPVADKPVEWSALNVSSSVFQPSVLAIGDAGDLFMSKSTGLTDVNGITSARFKIIKTEETQKAAATYYFTPLELLIKPNLNGATSETELFSALYEAKQENITVYSLADKTAPRVQNRHIAEGIQFVPFEAADTVLATSSSNILFESISGPGGIKEIASGKLRTDWPGYVQVYVRSFLIFPPGPTTQSVNFQVQSKIEQNYQDQFGNIIDGPQELNFDVSGAGGSDDRTGEQKEYYIFQPNPDTPTTFNDNGEIIRLPIPLYFLENDDIKQKLNALSLTTDYVEKTDNFLKLGIFRFTGVQWELQEFLSYEMVKSGVSAGSSDNVSNYLSYITAKAQAPYTVYTVAKAVDVNIAGTPSELLTGVGLDTNPFTPNGDGINDSVKITFKLGASARTSVKIYDSTGELVRVLEEGKKRSSGWQDGTSGSAVIWNGRYSWGDYVDPGIYIFEVQAVNINDNSVSKKTGMIGVVQ